MGAKLVQQTDRGLETLPQIDIIGKKKFVAIILQKDNKTLLFI